MGRKRKFNLIEQNQQSSSTPSTEEPSEKPEALEQEKVKEKTEFKVFGEDIVLSQIDFINYQKITNKMLFLQFHLLGRFDDKGSYYINNDIKQDLVNVAKEIQHEDDKGYLAEVRFAHLIFKFEVDLSYSQEVAEAKLYIIEKFDEHTIKTLVETFSAPNDADFRIKVRERFNLVDVAIKTGDEEVPNLSIWIYWQSEEYMYWRELYEMGSQFFVLRALAILESYGELGEKIIDEYNNRLSQLEDKGGKRKFSRAKECLDDVINKFGGLEKVDEGKGKLKNLAKEYNKPFLASEIRNVNMIEAEKPKTEKKTAENSKSETKPTSTKKTSTSTNSGGSAGNNSRAKATKKAGTKNPNTKDASKKKTIYYVTVSQEESKAGEAKTTNQPADNKARNETNATRTDSAKIENGRHEPSETKEDKEQAKDKTQVDPALMNNIVEDLAKDTTFISQEDDAELITHEAEADQPQAQRDLGGENITQENNSANNEEVSEMV